MCFNRLMFKPLPLYIGLRYTRAKRRTHFISFISVISIAGITLGVAALITVLSVMNGFEKELRDRILGMASHAQVSGLEGTLPNWQSVKKELESDPRVLGSAPQIDFEGMINFGDQVSGAIFHGVSPKDEREVSDVGTHMVAGSMDTLEDGKYHIVLGKELAQLLGIHLGQKVTVITPQAQVTPAGFLPRLRRFTVTGIFSVGMFEYDRGTAFIHLDDAARLTRKGDNVSDLRLKLKNIYDAPKIAREINNNLGALYWVSDWTQQHQNFFKAIKTERMVMFVILSLIVIVAAFNIVSTLVMLVNDKRADIAILRTLGLTPKQVMMVFIVQGTLIGLIGTAMGVLIGTLLADNVTTIVHTIENVFHVHFLSADVYYITDVPSDLRWVDVMKISAVAFLSAMVMTIYPAWQASRTQPAEALRYE